MLEPHLLNDGAVVQFPYPANSLEMAPHLNALVAAHSLVPPHEKVT